MPIESGTRLYRGDQLKPMRGWKLFLSVDRHGLEARKTGSLPVGVKNVLVQIDQALNVVAIAARSAGRG